RNTRVVVHERPPPQHAPVSVLRQTSIRWCYRPVGQTVGVVVACRRSPSDEGLLELVASPSLQALFYRHLLFELSSVVVFAVSSRPSIAVTRDFSSSLAAEVTYFQEPNRIAIIDSSVHVNDNGRESINKKVFFIFTVYNASNQRNKLKLGASSSEEAAKWIRSLQDAAMK
ncbi:hypothetical protein S245_055532, partial [Arachis hypogaea]